jgi:hypothetical protein
MSSWLFTGQINWEFDEDRDPIYAFEVRTPDKFYAVAAVQVRYDKRQDSHLSPMLLTFDSQGEATAAAIQERVCDKLASVWEGDDIQITSAIEWALRLINIADWPDSLDVFSIQGLKPTAGKEDEVHCLTADETLSCAKELIRLIPTAAATRKPGFCLPKLIRHTNEDVTLILRRDAKLNLDDCFAFFQAEERLGDENKWFCPTCQEEVRATKTTDVWRVPDILIVHYKRSWANSTCKRLVGFPDVLDMRPYVRGPGAAELKYRLYAVSDYGESLHLRPYAAHARVWWDGANRGKWVSFSYDSVSAGTAIHAHSPSAHVLFYEKIGTDGGVRAVDDNSDPEDFD